MRKGVIICVALLFAGLSLTFGGNTTVNVSAQAGPEMLVPNLRVRTTISDLVTPISMAFIGNNDFFVLEKNTGQVKRIVNGAVHSTVLDLGVNFASERGLLGIALHPSFPNNPGVYLYWTCAAPARPRIHSSPTRPDASTRTCLPPIRKRSCKCLCSAIASIALFGTAQP